MTGYVSMDDGVPLWFRVSGAGDRPVVLIHGGPGVWHNLEALETMLAESATVVSYDQRGCGRSERAGPYTTERFVADLESLRRHFGYERWTLVGHSWGASLALLYAWAHPQRVQSIAYISGTGLGKAWREAYREEETRRLTPEQNARLDELAGLERSRDEEREFLTLAWSRDFADRDTAIEQAARLVRDDLAVNYECNRQLNDECKTWQETELMDRCKALEFPILVLHGSEDPRPAWAVDSLVAALSHVHMTLIDGAGHLPWVERPSETEEQIRSFIGDEAGA